MARARAKRTPKNFLYLHLNDGSVIVEDNGKNNLQRLREVFEYNNVFDRKPQDVKATFSFKDKFEVQVRMIDVATTIDLTEKEVKVLKLKPTITLNSGFKFSLNVKRNEYDTTMAYSDAGDLYNTRFADFDNIIIRKNSIASTE